MYVPNVKTVCHGVLQLLEGWCVRINQMLISLKIFTPKYFNIPGIFGNYLLIDTIHSVLHLITIDHNISDN